MYGYFQYSEMQTSNITESDKYNSTRRAYSLSVVFRYSIIFTSGSATLPYQGQQ